MLTVGNEISYLYPEMAEDISNSGEQQVNPEQLSNKDLREALTRLDQAIPGDLVVQITKDGKPEVMVLPLRDEATEAPKYGLTTDWTVGVTDDEATFFHIEPPQIEAPYPEGVVIEGKKTYKVDLPITHIIENVAKSGGTEEQVVQAIEERKVGQLRGLVITSRLEGQEAGDAVLDALYERVVGNQGRDIADLHKVEYWQKLMDTFGSPLNQGEAAVTRIDKAIDEAKNFTPTPGYPGYNIL